LSPIEHTQAWLRSFVIKLGLCPFAHSVDQADNILYKHLALFQSDDLLTSIEAAIKEILFDGSPKTTALLIIETGLEVFENYLTVYNTIEHWLTQNNYEALIQLASFHPAYQFEGTEKDAPENFTNRSPYPIIHLLRTDDVTKAIASYPDVDSIPKNNITLMNKLGTAEIMKLLLSS